MTEIKNNSRQFEIFVDGKKAGEMAYNFPNEHTLNINHTEVDSEFSGHGLGKKLVDYAVDYVRKNNLKISATCSYANAMLKKNLSAQDIFVN